MTLKEGAPSLQELQAWMKWAITDPRGVDAALRGEPFNDFENAERYREPKEIGGRGRCLFYIDGPEPENRLSVYAEAYFSRILESFSSDFSRTLSLLGEFRFAKLVSEYLKKHPSQKKCIGEIAEHFPLFSRKHSLNEEFPFLKELIFLERMSLESFYSGEPSPETVSSLSKLSEITESDWNHLRIHLHPTLRVLTSTYPLVDLWESAFLKGELKIESNGKVNAYLLYSPRGHVSLQEVSLLAGEVVAQSLKGEKLFDILNDLPDELLADVNISELFAEWLENGWICGVSF